MLKAKVNIETGKRTYKLGDVIEEQLSDADMAFLRMHDFISTEEETDFAEPDFDDEDTDGIPNIGIDNNSNEDVYKDEDALKRLNKDEIVEYAASIGLKLDASSLKNDLIASVLDYIGELTEG